MRRPNFSHIAVCLCLASCVTGLLGGGCSTSRKFKAGDAIVHERRLHFHVKAGPPKLYRIELPNVPLSVAKQHHFSIRHPERSAQLDHLFMSLPQGDVFSGRGDERKSAEVLPWENVILGVIIQEPAGGNLVYSNHFRLGDLRWEFSKGDLKLDPAHHADRVFGWLAWHDLPGLKQALAMKSDYDAIITVAQPSTRKRDALRLRGGWQSSWKPSP